MTLFIMLGFILLIYFFLIRPQQKRTKAQRALLESLEVGDEILTSSGFYGTIEDFDEGTCFVRIADNTVVKISRSSIAQKIVYKESWEDDKEAEATPDEAVAETSEEETDDTK